MAEFRYKVGPLEITGDAEDMKKMIAITTQYSEMFGSSKCDHCDSENVRPKHRNTKGYDFYSKKCYDCGWELKYGVTKDTGELFPKEWEAPYEVVATQPPGF